MILVFLYLLNIQLLTRLVWISRDEPSKGSTLIVMLLIQWLACLALCVDLAFWFLLLGTLLINLGLLYLELNTKYEDVRPTIRLVSLVVWFIFYVVLCSDFVGLEFNPWFLTVLSRFQEGAALFGTVDSYRMFVLLTVSAGVMIAVWEAHVMIRFLFQKLKVKPGKEKSEEERGVITVGEVEYSRGRIIGGLERFLTFFLILNGSYGALGFLIAAKGITRFKQLDNREFAEYFLIGTLLSIILAGSIAWLTGLLLQTQKL